jgi:CelD/BcsL family acetyltransferase involved in cellulose biosynthesis
VRIDVAGSFEDYWDSRSKNLRRNLRGIQNKLATERVPIRFTVLRDADDMDPVIERHSMLERSGWKNVSGTPLTLKSNEGAFYDSLLKLRARQQRARVYQLYLGERLAASQLAVVDGSTLALLKTSYASDLSRFAPGRLLDYCMLEQIFAEGLIRRVEYCTIANDDDLRWSTSHRGVCEINLFRWPVLLGAASAVRRGRDAIRSLRSGSPADVAVT